MELLIIFLKSKIFFYFIIVIFFIVNRLYVKISKSLMENLGLELTSNSEIWEMIKSESEKGDIKARVAVVCHYLEIFCGITLFIIVMWAVL